MKFRDELVESGSKHSYKQINIAVKDNGWESNDVTLMAWHINGMISVSDGIQSSNLSTWIKKTKNDSEYYHEISDKQLGKVLSLAKKLEALSYKTDDAEANENEMNSLIKKIYKIYGK